MLEYAEKEGIMTQPLLISSFHPTDGVIFIPLLLWYLELGLVSTNVYRPVECTPVKSLTILWNLLSRVVVKDTRFPIAVLLQKLWSCSKQLVKLSPITLWIEVAIPKCMIDEEMPTL